MLLLDTSEKMLAKKLQPAEKCGLLLLFLTFTLHRSEAFMPEGMWVRGPRHTFRQPVTASELRYPGTEISPML